MKLKNIIHTAALALGIAALGASCTNIDDDDRLIYVKPPQVNRAVLIEDFTGQKCTNCPFAAIELEKIVEQYGEDHVVAVAIHSGLGMKYNPAAKYQGLMNDQGSEYYSAWGSPAQPAGMVNRSSQPLAYTEWGKNVRAEIEKSAPLSLSVENAYNEADRTLAISVKALGTDGNTDGKLQVWLIEDNIVSLQDMPKELGGGRNYEYVHKHVFRANVTADIWGDALSVKEGEKTAKSYNYTIPELWNAENVSVVAFVTDANNRNVKQVIKKSIINK